MHDDTRILKLIVLRYSKIIYLWPGTDDAGIKV